MKNKKILFLLLGLAFGIIIGISIHYLLPKNNEYYVLKMDYNIQKAGTIKAGTIIKFDKAFSEGFSRYVLYLNIPDSETLDKYKSEENDIIIPYWLREIDTIQVSK